MIASFVFAFERVGRERIRGPARTRAGRASRRPPKRSPISRSASTASRSNAIEVACAAGKRVPLPAPAEDRDRRNVGEVGDGAVRVAALDRRPRSARSSGCARAPGPRRPSGRTARASPRCGMFPYGASPSRIRSAPTTPARPTSMTPRGASRLSPTRNPRRKTAAAASTHVGQTDASSRRAPAEADPEPTGEQVREHGVDERDAAEDLSAVEERERDREPEKRKQVEVPHRERPAQIGEPEEEDEAEREPDVRLQERLPAERALAPARHLPGDLRARPRLGDAPGRVLDDRLGDLARLARPRPSRATCASPSR